ncbi:MAG: hypothetical protein HY901_18225 [Deltaproteobacteria bacterium]|nr:hypothetical protein [Deltaproteobacteria bacterium]
MPDSDIVVTRDILYEQVWKQPAGKVAATYGLTGTALAKICKKLGVPVPGRGYWAKVRAGHSPRRRKLPPLGLGQPKEHRIPAHRAHRRQQQAAIDLPEAPLIVVPDELRSPHPLVRGSAPIIRRAKPGRYALPHPEKTAACLNICVTKKSITRALLIMDTLIKALEVKGHRVEVTEPKHSGNGDSYGTDSRTLLHIGDQELEFDLREQLEKQPGRFFIYQTYNFVGTGRLTLHLHAWGSGVRNQWRDRPTQRLEDCLGDFIRCAVAAAEQQRLARAEWAREEKIEEARRQREAEEQRRREELARRNAEVERRAEDWSKARRIRECLAAATARGITADWLGWGATRAEELERKALC